MHIINIFHEEKTEEWNNFIDKAKNSTFLLKRGFMDYHKERFTDFSLMIYRDSELLALLPGCKVQDTFASHAGLSYGGLIYTSNLKQSESIQILDEIKAFLKQHKLTNLIYKEIPSIYCRVQSEEIIYALFKQKAELYRRDASTIIDMNNPIKWSKGRKALLSIAKKSNLLINDSSTDSTSILKCAANNLKNKYNKNLTHTPEELNLLKRRFPEKIEFIQIELENVYLCGAVLFLTDLVIHAQYIANTIDGKEKGAFELILQHILNKHSNKKYFDFGISTENDGIYLNGGLQTYKESFGARTFLFNHYKLSLI